MDSPASLDFPSARPLTESGTEAASRSLKIVIVTRGAFELDGATRTAFVVGPRTTPVAVRYLNAPDCHEWVVPPWMATALFDARGDALAGLVLELADLPRSPFRDALLRGDPTSRRRRLVTPSPTGRRDAAGGADGRSGCAGSGRRSRLLLSGLWALPLRPARRGEAAAAAAGRPGGRSGCRVTAVRRLVRHDSRHAVRLPPCPSLSPTWLSLRAIPTRAT